MRIYIAILIIGMIMTGCGYRQSKTTGDRSAGCLFFPSSCVAPRGPGCTQRAIQVAWIKSTLSTDLAVELSYDDMITGQRQIIEVQVPAEKELRQEIGEQFSITKDGYWEDSGNTWVAPTCTADVVEVPVKLGLTQKSFDTARNCRIADGGLYTGDHGGEKDTIIFYISLLDQMRSYCSGDDVDFQTSPE